MAANFIVYLQLVSIMCLLVHRFMLLIMPVFRFTVMQAPWINFVVGFLSDLGLIFLVFCFYELGKVIKGRVFPGIYKSFLLIFTIFVCIVLGAHVRYVEHFGTTIRPEHLELIFTESTANAGAEMVLENWHPIYQLLLPWFLAVLILVVYRLMQKRWSWNFSRKKLFLTTAVLCLSAYSASLTLRHNRRIEPELKYNVATGLYKSYQEVSAQGSLPRPYQMNFDPLRKHFGPYRKWSEPFTLRHFPLWQEEIATGKTINPKLEEVRDGVRNFLQERQRQVGRPWNVLLVLFEAMRAHEVDFYGNKEDVAQGLVPNFQRSFKDGIYFKEVLHTGLASRWGHLATQCSLYSIKDFPLMPSSPFADIKCLPDIFYDKGYDTVFLYGGRLGFEHRDDFYVRHKKKKILSFEDYAPDITKNGWGASDFELYKRSEKVFDHELKEPFYGTIFTMSNHSPRILPTDAPDFINRNMPEKYKVLQYVDWVWGKFYDKVVKKFPHTIIIAVADHGGFLGDDIGLSNRTYADMRRLARIPWAIIVPGLPEKYRGVAVEHLATNADVGPTLLSLLGETKISQSFMGMDAFARNEPVFINWFGSLRQVTQIDPKTGELTTKVSEPVVVDKQIEKLFNSMHKWEKFGPHLSYVPDRMVIKPGKIVNAEKAIGKYWAYLANGQSMPIQAGMRVQAKLLKFTGDQEAECLVRAYQRLPWWADYPVVVLQDVEKCNRHSAH